MERKEIIINTEYITLVQLLQFANITQSGGESKFFIEENQVYYNGEIETRKRKKVYPNDIIKINNQYELLVKHADK